MTDHGNIILQLQRERSEILDRLIEARTMLSYDMNLLEGIYARDTTWGADLGERLKRQRAFLEAGLFGEAKGSETK